MTLMEKAAHAAERKAFEKVLENFIQKGKTADAASAAQDLVDMAEKIQGSVWKKESFEVLHMIAGQPEGKWAHYVQRILDETDPYILKTFLTNAVYEGGFRGYQQAQKNAEKYRKQKHRHEKHPRSRQQSADQPEGKMAETLENTGQASSQNESAGVVSGTFVHCDSWLCHLFFQDVKDRRGTSSDLSVCGRHCTGGVIAFTSGVGFFLQRRAGDGYVGRLCGADEKLDRRDSSREKS